MGGMPLAALGSPEEAQPAINEREELTALGSRSELEVQLFHAN